MKTDWKNTYIQELSKVKNTLFRNQHQCGHYKWKLKWLNSLYTYVHKCTYLYACNNDNYEDMNFEDVGGIRGREGKLTSDGKAIVMHEIHWKKH